MKELSKHASESGLRVKRGKWEYRFNLQGRPYSQVTDLESVPANINKAQALRSAHIEQLKRGKPVLRRVTIPIDQVISQFLRWYVSEHPRGGKCKWAVSLMASFQYYFEQTGCALARIGPAELENFKTWRRENNIHDNSLRKQLLLLGQFFKFSRKHGWVQGDPFAAGQDAEVVVPVEQDSDAMHVLSPDEEVRYFTAALQESIDLHDVALIMLNQGLRPDEVMSLRQCHVDLTHQHFSVWESTAEGKS